MIKVEKEYISESYWHKDDFCDNKRDKKLTIRLFGIKVFYREDHYKTEPGQPLPEKENGLGFKK